MSSIMATVLSLKKCPLAAGNNAVLVWQTMGLSRDQMVSAEYRDRQVGDQHHKLRLRTAIRDPQQHLTFLPAQLRHNLEGGMEMRIESATYPRFYSDLLVFHDVTFSS